MSSDTTKILKFSNRVISGLALAGYKPASWARNRGYAMTTVHQAIHGTRNGKKTKKIRKELEAYV